MKKKICSIALGLGLACAVVVVPSQPAYAQPTSTEANTHFQRAVQLYSEADYRAALVEFKKAYELAPHVTVLYNIGETYYQLQNYAAALDTFERFLAEGGTVHRQEVENAIAVLKTRVGKLDVTTTAPGYEIAIDDEVVGKTPLAKPVSVSIGRRKVTATKPGEPPITKAVDVAAGETQPVKLEQVAAVTAPNPGPPPEQPKPADNGSSIVTIGWITTGVLAAGTVVTGILAASSASSLKDARNAFPADKNDVDSKASTTTTLALVTDILGAATLVAGGVSLYFTLTKPSSSGATTPTTRVGVAGSKLLLEGSF